MVQSDELKRIRECFANFEKRINDNSTDAALGFLQEAVDLSLDALDAGLPNNESNVLRNVFSSYRRKMEENVNNLRSKIDGGARGSQIFQIVNYSHYLSEFKKLPGDNDILDELSKDIIRMI